MLLSSPHCLHPLNAGTRGAVRRRHVPTHHSSYTPNERKVNACTPYSFMLGRPDSRGGRVARPTQPATLPSGPGSPLISPSASVQDPAGVDRLLRAVRWIAAVLCVVQFSLYSAPPGVDIPFSRWWGAVPSAMVVAVNVAGLVRSRRGLPQTNRWFMTQLVWDSLITAVIIGMFTFDDTSALWAL